MTLVELEPAPTAAARRAGAPDRPPRRARHTLEAGGLLELDRLAALADRLPAASVEHNLGAVPAVLPGGQAPRADLSPGEVVRGIATNGCWIVLKNVEQDPEYGRLLDACLDDVEPVVTAGEGRSLLREGFVFLSCPGSVTPVHIDPEHNVLLQVRGRKTMSIGRFPDDEALHRQAEELHGGGHRNLPVDALDLQDFPLEPGDGVYVPVLAPHVVRNGPEVSVSLSITWRTRATLRAGRVHAFSARRRRSGRSPVLPGRSVVRDEVVAGLERVAGRLRAG